MRPSTAPTSPIGPHSLVVSLHDVSPHTRADCDAILRELADLGVPRTSLLVIPDHHHRGHIADDPAFGEWLRAQSAAGHEIVMHGYFHQRARRAAESVRDRFTTRLYTADEGEFYDLDRATATALLTKSRGEFRRLGYPPAVRFTEYDDWPRGRIVYEVRESRFSLYCDRRIQDRPDAMDGLIDAFGLRDFPVEIRSDRHYR